MPIFEVITNQGSQGDVYARPGTAADIDGLLSLLVNEDMIDDSDGLFLHGHTATDQGGQLDFLDADRNFVLSLKPLVRITGPCGACFPPGILQYMNGTETQTCDDCRIYASDRGAQAALRRLEKTTFWTTGRRVPASVGNMTPDEHDLEISLRVRKHRGQVSLGIEVLCVDLVSPGPADYFEWPYVEWREDPYLGFDPLTSRRIELKPGELEQIFVAMDKYLEGVR